jgi:hypothetical protein
VSCQLWKECVTSDGWLGRVLHEALIRLKLWTDLPLPRRLIR